MDTNRAYAQVIEGADNLSGLTRLYLYGDDLISQSRVSGNDVTTAQSDTFLYDGLGSVRTLTDSTGAITDTYTYEAFGGLDTHTGTTENRYLFTGEQFDPNVGFYYLRARYYNPSIGRFQTMDTWLGKECTPITLNKYVYGNANPVSFIDPSGHMGIVDVGAALNIRSITATSSQASFRVTVRRIGSELACVAIEETVNTLVMQQLTGGIYVLADNGAGYVGRRNDFDRRMNEHRRSGKRKVEGVLALFHMDMDRNDQRLVEQFFMDSFREANQPLTNQRNSIARNPVSSNSRRLRRMMDNLDFCK